MASPPPRTKYIAKLRVVDDQGRFRQYSPMVYYFDKEMVELGYQVNGEFYGHTAGRVWSDDMLDKYYIKELRI